MVPTGTREDFYESRLLRGLPWYCVAHPETNSQEPVWVFRADPPKPEELGADDPAQTQHVTIDPGNVFSFEEKCAEIEDAYEAFGCSCCAGEESHRCDACHHAVGFHTCQQSGLKRWRRGTLHGGSVDVQQTLLALCKRMVPLQVLAEKVKKYREAGLMNAEEADYTLKVLEQQCRAMRETDAHAGEEHTGDGNDSLPLRLSTEEMRRELEHREHLLRLKPARSSERCNGHNHESGSADREETDQWRLYEEIRTDLQGRRPVRKVIQASAGTGKSFLLTTLFLWCVLTGLRVCACAPTGIAAANITIPGTDIGATTLHHLFDLKPGLDTNFDFAKEENPKLRQLAMMDVLFVDEFSMLDVEIWSVMQRFLKALELLKRKNARSGEDDYGENTNTHTTKKSAATTNNTNNIAIWRKHIV